MSMDRPTLRLTRLAYALLGIAFVTVFLFALERSLRLESELATEVRQQAKDELHRVLHLWEQLEIRRIEAVVQELAPDPVARARLAPPFVDAVLVWQAAAPGVPGTMLRPADRPRPDMTEARADPCLVAAEARTAGSTDRLAIAEAWRACTERPVAVALIAASRAADQYLAAGRAEAAVAALQAVDLPLDAPRDLLDAVGVTIDAAIARQVQLAEALAATGRRDEAVRLLRRAGDRIVALDPPDLDRLLSTVDFPIIPDLEALDAAGEADTLRDAVDRARRRLEAWRLVHQGVSTGTPLAGAPLFTTTVDRGDQPTPVPVAILGDPSGQRRVLLAVARLPGGLRLGLQLDPEALLRDLLESGPGRPLQVLDATGNVVLPGDAMDADLLATVPFGRLLPELRLGMLGTATSTERIRAWRRSQLLPIAVVLVMAGFAVVARLAADRQQHELWERQQAFVNRVSHELKTPLAGIKVMAELIEMGVVSGHDEVVQSAQRIITETSRMENRVNEILKQARRPELGEKVPLDITAMAAALAEEWTPRFEQRDARLLVQLDPTPPVLGDRELLRDAINNLLDNALKYLREDVAGLVRLRTSSAGRWVVVEVADNGLGVPEDMRRAIFERFTRVEGDGRGKAGGHGLGLAFVAEAVREHGGRVECREGIGGGARFIIRLRRM
ncbi:MAG: sensor histidine kinase [Deltaproteobacteria bacterium]|nr:MAG: sensor histidine kinase [Deltaproteobacteria bacterium]